jgi:hypothetical protein
LSGNRPRHSWSRHGAQSRLDGFSQTLPELYAIPTADFHDITSGNNDTGSGGYSAKAGYDEASGIGTPIVNLLIPDMVRAGSTLSGNVFQDHNADGIENQNDAGLKSWTIQLEDTNNVVLNTTTTDANGNYSFNVGPGTYRIREVVQTGWTQTTPNPKDIKAGFDQTLTIPSFGDFKLVNVKGQTLTDLTGNGFTSDDTGLGGVSVSLYQDTNNNGVLDINDKLVSTVVSASSGSAVGSYAFSGLAYGTYFVKETAPNGYVQSAPTSPTIYTLLATSGNDALADNFDNFKSVTITGHTLNDAKGNDNSTDESPLGGVTVKLYVDTGSGVLDSSSRLFGTVVTPASGLNTGIYNFNNLGPGTYFVQEVAPTGYTQLQPSSPAYYTITITTSIDVTGKDFDNFKAAAVSGTTFTDITGNGLTADDTPLGGVTVTLYQDNGDGIFDSSTDAVYGTPQITAANGSYSFTGLNPGTYFIQETVPDGYVQTAPTTASFYTITAISNGNLTNQNFDNFKTITITGRTLQDTTGNGLSVDDTPLGNVTVTLY